MKYLYIDASDFKTYAQIGVLGGYKIRTFDTNRDFAAKITTICDEMLSLGSISIDELNFLGVGLGPGSLTGLRVAGAFMRALSMVSGCELVGVDRFTWGLKSLLEMGIESRVRIIMPTLIDKAFSLYADLPSLTYTQPVLVELSDLQEEIVPTFGIDYANNFIKPLELSASALHDLIVADKAHVKRALQLSEILEVLPMYIIPSQAERKLEARAGDAP